MEKNIWKIRDVKRSGRKIFKNNWVTLVMITLFITLIFGGSIGNRNGYSSFKNAFEQIQNFRNYGQTKDEKQIIVEEIDKIVSQYLSGNMNGFIKEYNEKNNVYSGFIFSAFNVISNSESEIQNFVKTVSTDDVNLNTAKAALVVISGFALLIRILVINPIAVGEKRVFLESINYRKTKFSTIVFPFKRKRYKDIIEAMFVVRLYQLLWNITIVGGIIKHYSYLMVPYILAENPNIHSKDAIKISKEMMKGNKWKAFLLDFSFLGWEILNLFTLGLVGIYYGPYYTSTFTELYNELRKKYIEQELYQYELLNDFKLYENLAELGHYPDDIRKKRERTLLRIYDFVDIILMFFVFSVAGWFMEMNLFYFLDGTIVNRGALYGPWLPIYGFGCSSIIVILNVLNKYSSFRFLKKIEENPFIVFITVMILCTILEFLTSYVMEKTMGLKYWDYSGHFMNIEGRVCLENSLFFGAGGCLCIYIIAPFLQRAFSKISKRVKIVFASSLIAIMLCDATYSHFVPHTGDYITTFSNNNIRRII